MAQSNSVLLILALGLACPWSAQAQRGCDPQQDSAETVATAIDSASGHLKGEAVAGFRETAGEFTDQLSSTGEAFLELYRRMLREQPPVNLDDFRRGLTSPEALRAFAIARMEQELDRAEAASSARDYELATNSALLELIQYQDAGRDLVAEREQAKANVPWLARASAWALGLSNVAWWNQ